MHTGKRIVSRALMLISVLALIAGCAPTSFAPGQASLGPSNASVVQVQSSAAGVRPVDSATGSVRTTDIQVGAKPRVAASKPIDQPNPQDKARMMARQRALESGNAAQAAALAQTGTDRVLVILAEFAGTDVFTWTAPITPTDPSTGSQWDPLGIADAAEDTGTLGDCSLIITQTTTFTYTGPLHNQIERPLSASDASGQSIWTPDFTPQWYMGFTFGNGVVISYTRQDNSQVHVDFTGQSVKNYYKDLSSSTYTITGDIVGWVQVPHSTWYYDADQCPGARSTGDRPTRGGMIPGAGSPEDLVTDAVNQVNAISNTIPGFNWANYDLDGDGVVDRLWLVHAGLGEEESPTLLNRDPVVQNTFTTPDPASFYGEAAVWSHSSQVTPPYSVTQNTAVSSYIVMPESGGMAVFAHEYGHNLGADDLYSYGDAETSAGFWTIMSDSWTGNPIGFQPPSMDPWHLDNWGWLNPKVITDTSKVYTVTLGQASYFNTNTAGGPVYSGIKIPLEDGQAPLALLPWAGDYYWWGGNEDVANGMMTSKTAISLPASSAITLTFDTVYGIETEWDFMWVQVSTDNGTSWDTITNTNSTCTHVAGWIGDLYNMDGECGFTDYNADFPDPTVESFDLSAYAGEGVLLRFWYMTDWGTTYEGPFVDNVMVQAGTSTLFADDAETGGTAWDYESPWMVSSGTQPFSHNYYVQWRNTNANGGYDASLGTAGWRYAPANTGMVVWYNNNFYKNNDVFNSATGLNVLNDFPGFGPKGRMLVVEAHPDPYRAPQIVAQGYNNEAANVTSRSAMRDAPFTLQPTVNFTQSQSYAPFTSTTFTNQYPGRPAISKFSDALGYYPGAENVPGGPVGQTSPRWMTNQWDVSVVIPAKEFYGVKAPGYTDGTRFRFDCSFGGTGNAQVLCFSYAAGLGYNGGTGNPGDQNAQFGWHIELIEEAADHTWAKVRVYNAMKAATQAVAPDVVSTSFNNIVKYTYTMAQNLGSPLSLFACAPLDTSKVEFVAGSGTNGAVALPMSCAAATAALAKNSGDLKALAAEQASSVASVGWTGGNIGSGVSSPGFSFQVKAKLVAGTLHQSVNLYDGGSWWTTLDAANVNVIPAVRVFLPLVLR